MAINEKYCSECGAKNPIENQFCVNCGTQFPKQDMTFQSSPQYDEQPLKGNYSEGPVGSNYQQPPNYSQLGNYQAAPGYSPVVITPIKSWEGGTVMDAAKGMVLKPRETAPAVLTDPNAPSGIIFVHIMAVVSALFNYVSALRVRYEYASNVPQEFRTADLNAFTPSFISSLISGILGVYISWYVGSWIMGLFIKGGIPINSPVYPRFNAVLRNLNAYRYIPSIIGNIILILALFIEPPRLILISMQDVLGTGTPIPLPVPQPYSILFTIIAVILIVGALVVALYMLYHSIMSLGYNGSGLMILIFIIGAFEIYSVYSNYIKF